MLGNRKRQRDESQKRRNKEKIGKEKELTDMLASLGKLSPGMTKHK